MNALLNIKKKLKELSEKKSFSEDYIVPNLWLDIDNKHPTKHTKVNPYRFFLDKIDWILSNRVDKKNIDKPFVYNMLLRYTTAFNHDESSKDTQFTVDGFRKTGTFLKAIAILSYIKSLGANTVYLLPITSIGKDGKKGKLGSPYAIKNPYQLDENLSEPILETSIEEQFLAYVEAAHLLGMDVILEFVFRTASIDSDLALQHPHWFYWIKKDIEDRQTGEKDLKKYGAPDFTETELEKIKLKIESNDLKNLIAPNKLYRSFFTDAPEKAILKDDRIYGLRNGQPFSRVPSAFADWPPNDTQPPWSDVTYLKLYDNKDFNYIAYNTVRMYDEALAKEKYIVRDLWDSICGIIPYFQKEFGIDGVLLDMGHSLPSALRMKICNEARLINNQFKFWEENFSLSKQSVDDGYDAVVGYMPFDAHIPQKLNSLISRLATEGSPLPFFATPETHNTPRAFSRGYGIEFSKMIWTICCFLPEIPFIHSGFELGESIPVNTGLGFTYDEQSKFPASILPLFSECYLDWNNENQWTEYLRRIVDIRKQFSDIVENNEPETIIPLITSDDNCIAFLRVNEDKSRFIMLCGSMLANETITTEIEFEKEMGKFFDFVCGKVYEVDNNIIKIHLKPFQTVCGEIVFG